MGPAYKGTLAAASRGCSSTTCTAALGEAAGGGRCSGDRCSIPSAVSPPLPINVGAINGCSGCIDAWQHQPAVSYNYQPTSEMVPQLPSLLARHSKTKRPSVLAGNRPIFIILSYYTRRRHERLIRVEAFQTPRQTGVRRLARAERRHVPLVSLCFPRTTGAPRPHGVRHLQSFGLCRRTPSRKESTWSTTPHNKFSAADETYGTPTECGRGCIALLASVVCGNTISGNMGE